MEMQDGEEGGGGGTEEGGGGWLWVTNIWIFFGYLNFR